MCCDMHLRRDTSRIRLAPSTANSSNMCAVAFSVGGPAVNPVSHRPLLVFFVVAVGVILFAHGLYVTLVILARKILKYIGWLRSRLVFFKCMVKQSRTMT